MKQLLGIFSIAVISLLALALPAKADQIADDTIIDPFFVESMGLANTCPANCGSVVLAVDPLSGKTTVEYIFNSTIPNVVAGDVKVTEFGSSTVDDLIRFEDLSGVAVAFLYSYDNGKYLADVGPPPSYQSNTWTISEDKTESTGFTYLPTSVEPGFCRTLALTACSSRAEYGLQSADPEPGTLALFGAGLIGLGALRRRRKSKSQANVSH